LKSTGAGIESSGAADSGASRPPATAHVGAAAGRDPCAGRETVQPREVTKEKSDLEGLTVSRVKAPQPVLERTAQDRDTAPTPETLVVNVGITHLKKVAGISASCSARRGPGSMTTEITLVDSSTGSPSAGYTVIGQSGGSGLAGGTSEAVTKTAEAVAGLLGGGAVR